MTAGSVFTSHHRYDTGAFGLDAEDAHSVIQTALAEDLRYGPDLTSLATVSPDQLATAEFVPRRSGTVAGVPVALMTFDVVQGAPCEVLHRVDDGSVVAAGEPVIVLRGRVRDLLVAERTALNLLCHLSGIATLTASWVSALTGTGCVVRDSRKTLPGLRLLQKYAVRCGGGRNHRMGLGDRILIKDNHVAPAGSVSGALRAARTVAANVACEVEVDTLDAFDEALTAGAQAILLDNFTVADCAEAVRRRNERARPVLLEASGGLTLDVAEDYARTGVNYLAVGALTHSAPALDIGMDLRA